MDANEFKAWFDGYCEGIGGKVPTKAQWDRIREKVEELHDSATPPVWIPNPIYVEQPNPLQTTWISATGVKIDPSYDGFAFNTSEIEIQ